MGIIYTSCFLLELFFVSWQLPNFFFTISNAKFQDHLFRLSFYCRWVVVNQATVCKSLHHSLRLKELPHDILIFKLFHQSPPALSK